MRLGNVLHVISYRMQHRKISNDTVVLFVDHLCRLLRGNSLILDRTSRHAWGGQVHHFLQTPLPVEKERAAWTNSKGGYGARDIWDMLSSCAAQCISTDLTEKQRDSNLYSLFVIAALIVPVSKALLGGAYGIRVAAALECTLEMHAPESQQIPVRVGDGKCVFEHFAKFFKRIEGSTKTDIECYLNCLTTTLRLPPEQVYNGVLAHFVSWSGGKPFEYKSVRTIDQVVQLMLSTPDLAKKYLAHCKTQKQIQVALHDSVTRVPIDLGEVFSSYTSLNRIVKECTSPNTAVCPKRCCADVLSTAFSEAEFEWEHP